MNIPQCSYIVTCQHSAGRDWERVCAPTMGEAYKIGKSTISERLDSIPWIVSGANFTIQELVL